jgi:hypothetical protein
LLFLCRIAVDSGSARVGARSPKSPAFASWRSVKSHAESKGEPWMCCPARPSIRGCRREAPSRWGRDRESLGVRVARGSLAPSSRARSRAHASILRFASAPAGPRALAMRLSELHEDCPGWRRSAAPSPRAARAQPLVGYREPGGSPPRPAHAGGIRTPHPAKAGRQDARRSVQAAAPTTFRIASPARLLPGASRTLRLRCRVDRLSGICPVARLDGRRLVWPLLVGLSRVALERLMERARDHAAQELRALAATAGGDLLQLRCSGIIELDHNLFHAINLKLQAAGLPGFSPGENGAAEPRGLALSGPLACAVAGETCTRVALPLGWTPSMAQGVFALLLLPLLLTKAGEV